MGSPELKSIAFFRGGCCSASQCQPMPDRWPHRWTEDIFASFDTALRDEEAEDVQATAGGVLRD